MHGDSTSPEVDTSHRDTSHHDTNHRSHQEVEHHDLNSHFHSHEDPEDHHHSHHNHHKHQHDGPADETNPLLPPSYNTMNYYHPPPHIEREHRITETVSVVGSIFKAVFVLVWFGMAGLILVQVWKSFFCPLQTGSMWDVGCTGLKL